MLLNNITLYNFRNFSQVRFSFNSSLTVIYGANARGKTNLLEAVYCLTHGEGFRESKEEELIMFNQSKAKIEGILTEEDYSTLLTISFEKKNHLVEKKYYLNKVKKPLGQFLSGSIGSILFSPQQLEIITGSPEIRRRYFDKWIGGYDLEYKKRLRNYENALKRRNKILEIYQNEKELKAELFFWDDYLIRQADYIYRKRSELVEFLNRQKEIDDKIFSIKYLTNRLTKETQTKIFFLEKRYRKTLIGPQKDDFQIDLIENNFVKNLHRFGSRSEHRLGVFWLKINEIKYYQERFKTKPILLLDDVFSELDKENKKLILRLVKKYQTILTTTELKVVELIQNPKVVIKI